MANIVTILMNPETYDEPVKKVRLIQTHISWNFLTGKHVYKVKKPVNFGFLDFTTLEKRKFYCKKELEINKKLSPEMYIEVVSINKSDDKIKVKGEGNPIEYAIKMKEFPQDRIMSKLFMKNLVDKKLIERIAEKISEFHSNAVSKKINYLENIRHHWDQNFSQTKEFFTEAKDKKFNFIKDKVNSFLTVNKPLFEQRINKGRIRECHDDLHSGNIFIVDNEIYIFDAIEFNEEFRFIDVANDIAFFAMDLDFYGKEDLSIYFINRYVEFSSDVELLKLLIFYKCYRAYVRFKINVLKSEDKDINKKEMKESIKLARKYFDLAFEYAMKL